LSFLAYSISAAASIFAFNSASVLSFLAYSNSAFSAAASLFAFYSASLAFSSYASFEALFV
jgi:hypothetical protein